MPLEPELKFFESKRAEWLKVYEGKFAVITGESLLGVYDTAESAFSAGIKAWGNVSFLVKQILPEDPIEQIPALTHGLLNAHP